MHFLFQDGDLLSSVSSVGASYEITKDNQWGWITLYVVTIVIAHSLRDLQINRYDHQCDCLLVWQSPEFRYDTPWC